MKRITVAVAAVICLGLVLESPASGDVIPEGTHVVNRKVMVTNLDEFPDVVLVAYTVGPMIDGYEAALVAPNVPLDKGYKFNLLRLFAIQKSAIDNAGGLGSIDLTSLAERVTPAEIIDPGIFTVVDANPLESTEYYYRIQSVGGSAITLTLAQRILKYNDGTPDRVEDF